MTEIKVGDALPEATFVTMTAEGPMPRTAAETFGGRKVAVFAVPGAFTPTCHKNHLPSYLQNMDALAAAGIDAVACVAVNDVFVLAAWADATGAAGKIEMLADGSGAFTQAIGMGLDLNDKGLGLRSKRYAMLVDDGIVRALQVEGNPGEAVSSTAQGLLAAL